MKVKEREKIDSLFLSEEERAEGYLIATDAENNITLLKWGKRIAWFSNKAETSTVRSLIRLVIQY